MSRGESRAGQAETHPGGPIALVIVKASFGELDWILPVLYRLRESPPGFETVVLFEKRQAYESVRANRFVFEMISELALLLAYPDELDAIFPELIDPDRVRLIVKDFGASTPGLTRATQAFPRALVVGFPHATHPYGNAHTDPLGNPPYVHPKPIQDVLLLGSDHDWPFWSARAPVESFRTVGFPRYDRHWVRIVTDPRRLRGRPERVLSERAKRVFLLIMRGPDPVPRPAAQNEFLRPEHYEELCDTIFEETLRAPDSLLLIRTHPRQDIGALERTLARYRGARWLRSDLHLMQLASLSDVTISMCTSGALDALAVGVPLIECFRFDADYPYWRRNARGEPTSIYRELGLAVGAQNREQLRAHIDSALEGRAPCWEQQRRAFHLHCRFEECASERAAEQVLEEARRRGVLGDLATVRARAGSAELALRRAGRLARAGDLDRAIAVLQPLACGAELASRVLNDLGVLHWCAGRAERALTLLRLSARSSPGWCEGVLNQLAIHLETGSVEQAAELVRALADTTAESAASGAAGRQRIQFTARQLRRARALIAEFERQLQPLAPRRPSEPAPALHERSLPI